MLPQLATVPPVEGSRRTVERRAPWVNGWAARRESSVAAGVAPPAPGTAVVGVLGLQLAGTMRALGERAQRGALT
ncbi:MAG TPA: hypothetical protein VNG12_04340 [Acidimicrobiales bacterium]|nr:hypothetical protein [Acidimicrobiales bacterium]